MIPGLVFLAFLLARLASDLRCVADLISGTGWAWNRSLLTLDRVYISCSEKKGPFREETFKLKAGKKQHQGTDRQSEGESSIESTLTKKGETKTYLKP